MGERRVMIAINPPDPGRCRSEDGSCAHLAETDVGYSYCELSGDTLGFGIGEHDSVDRPPWCSAAEEQVAALQGGIIARVQEIADGLWPHGTEKRDRVADALAALQGGE